MKNLLAVLVVLIFAAPSPAGDWPAYRRDPQRSAATDESLAFPLRPLWEYRCAQPPAPAWGEQLNLLNRVDFDYAPHPVIAGGLLIFASSADDTIRALDAVTGQEKWHFITGGPVRVPPQIAGGKITSAPTMAVLIASTPPPAS